MADSCVLRMYYLGGHWKWNEMKFSSLAAPEVVILTTSGAVSGENVVKMLTFPF